MSFDLSTGKSPPPSAGSAKTNRLFNKVHTFTFHFSSLTFDFRFLGVNFLLWVSKWGSGLLKIVLEAQKSVGWYHDESDSGPRVDRVAKNVGLATVVSDFLSANAIH